MALSITCKDRFQQSDFSRNRHDRAKLLGLREGTARQRLTRYSRWETQVILYPCRSAGLATEGLGIEDENRQTFGRRIDGSSKTRWACTDWRVCRAQS